MAKKKVKEYVVETVDDSVETTVAPEEVTEKVAEIKPKRSRKKKVEVPADEVVAVDDKGTETPLTEIVPEIAGEIVTADVTDAEVATSFIEDVEPVKEQLDEAPVEEKPAPKKTTNKKTAAKKSTTTKSTAKKSTPKKTETKAEKPKDNSITLNGLVWLYPTSVAPRTTKTISGKVYVCGEKCTGRYPITTNPEDVGDISKNCGWINADYIER